MQRLPTAKLLPTATVTTTNPHAIRRDVEKLGRQAHRSSAPVTPGMHGLSEERQLALAERQSGCGVSSSSRARMSSGPHSQSESESEHIAKGVCDRAAK